MCWIWMSEMGSFFSYVVCSVFTPSTRSTMASGSLRTFFNSSARTLPSTISWDTRGEAGRTPGMLDLGGSVPKRRPVTPFKYVAGTPLGVHGCCGGGGKEIMGVRREEGGECWWGVRQALL
jgi:hypothetical protein